MAWPLVPLGEVCIEKTGTSDPSKLGDTHFIYVDIGSVDANKKQVSAARSMPGTTAPSRARRKILEGDVILSMTRPNLNAVALIDSALDGQICSTGFCVLRAGPCLNARYLFHFVQTAAFVEKLSSLTAGALYPAVSEAQVRQQLIPLPPLPEQQRIVEILDRAAAIQRLRKAAEQKAREIIPALFVDIFGDPAKNQKRWPVTTVSAAGEVKLGRQRAPKYQSGKFTRPYIRVANVFENRIDVSDLLSMDFDKRDFETYRLDYGDILLNEGQSIELVGRPAMWRNEVQDCCFQNTLVRFRCDPALIVPEFALAAFLRMYHNGDLSKIASKTSNIAHLGAGRFAKLPMVLPPIQLQTAFAEQAQHLEAIARASEAATAKALLITDSLTATMLTAT